MTYRQKQALERGLKAWEELPMEQRRRLLTLLRTTRRGSADQTARALGRYAYWLRQTDRKAREDAQRDLTRRTLVGARMPREDAEKVKKAAEITKRSVYRLVTDAIRAEVARVLP